MRAHEAAHQLHRTGGNSTLEREPKIVQWLRSCGVARGKNKETGDAVQVDILGVIKVR